MDSKLYSHTSVEVGSRRVHIAFTGTAAGNLGYHVGNRPEVVSQSRAELEDTLKIGERGFIYLNQVHGIDVYVTDDLSDSQAISKELDSQGAVATADAAVTSTGQPLAVMVADCIPIVLVGQQEKTHQPILAVAHAGRRGLLDGVIQQTVGEMKVQGAERIRVWIGPSICGSCYEVPEEMRKESSNLIPEVFSTTSWQTPALDLPAGARAVLTKLPDIAEVNDELAACTYETDTLFSHRRGEPQGRLAGLVWIEEREEQ